MLAITMFLLTIGVFLLMTRLYARLYHPLFVPVLTSTVVISSVLILFQIPYETYMTGGGWIDSMLGPAVVALAYPIFRQKDVIKAHMVPILLGVLAGLCTALLTGVWFAKLFGIDRTVSLTMVPKSLTTPVAIPVSDQIGGIPSMTIVFTMIAGFTGIVLGPLLLRLIKVDQPLGRGMAFGSASHALGTSKAFEYGEESASMSSVAMSLSAVFGSVIGPLFVWLFHI
ncbi:LrgB family protein [Halobacillus sp. A5]|uniref:LrgB family protein n=1 Tax=Halobacillus sp. A5 TaxID=2880263 RepID=UPI0020A6BC2B|nr:LrgB family protein [Halobacillus sp. A5]MCP3027197.1 LrgB family protein [Halobacillus sp. A5]